MPGFAAGPRWCGKRLLCRIIQRRTGSEVLLAMQKVVGSNPISRSRKGLRLQVFFVGAVGWCVCFAPDRNRTRGKAAVHSTRRKRLFAGNSGSFELLTSCGGNAEGHEFDPSGESGFSPESGVSASRPRQTSERTVLVPSRRSTLRPIAPDASSSSISSADGSPAECRVTRKEHRASNKRGATSGGDRSREPARG